MVTEPAPYTDEGDLRTFGADIDPACLKWHWDEQHRYAIPMHETDWMFQYDNYLPEPMYAGQGFHIPAGMWHRLHKGTGSLTLRILKDEHPIIT